MKTKILALALATAGLLPGLAEASLVLNTGQPDNTGFPLSLDASDYYAAEFNLGAGLSLNSIQGWITAGGSGQPGDTFTVAVYAADGHSGLPGTLEFAGQATYQADGWNGLSNLNVSGLSAGNYWAAFEVGAADSTAGLLLPTQALNNTSFAFNNGGSYQSMTGEAFGVQVSAVPLPGALWLMVSGLATIGGMARRRQLV